VVFDAMLALAVVEADLTGHGNRMRGR